MSINKRNPPSRLTTRHLDVIYWAYQGNTVSQTADLLGLDPATVKSHRDSAFIVLGVHSMMAAVNLCNKLGLLRVHRHAQPIEDVGQMSAHLKGEHGVTKVARTLRGMTLMDAMQLEHEAQHLHTDNEYKAIVTRHRENGDGNGTA